MQIRMKLGTHALSNLLPGSEFEASKYAVNLRGLQEAQKETDQDKGAIPDRKAAVIKTGVRC